MGSNHSGEEAGALLRKQDLEDSQVDPVVLARSAEHLMHSDGSCKGSMSLEDRIASGRFLSGLCVDRSESVCFPGTTTADVLNRLENDEELDLGTSSSCDEDNDDRLKTEEDMKALVAYQMSTDNFTADPKYVRCDILSLNPL